VYFACFEIDFSDHELLGKDRQYVYGRKFFQTARVTASLLFVGQLISGETDFLETPSPSRYDRKITHITAGALSFHCPQSLHANAESGHCNRRGSARIEVIPKMY
jgi:hypothetical protein